MIDFFNILKKTQSVVSNLLFPNQLEKKVKEILIKKKVCSSQSGDIVVVQATQDLYYFALLGAVSVALSNTYSYRFEQFLCSSLFVGESASLRKFIVSRVYNFLSKYKWKNLHTSFCDGVAYQSTGFQSPLTDFVDFYKAYNSWRNIASKDELNLLTVDNVLIGDLVNDSYLRFKPSPTLDLKDIYLLIVIFQAYRDIRRAKKYFGRKKTKLYLTSYSTYIQHGVAARVALQYGVKVFSFGNYQEFFKELSVEDWFHTKSTNNYAKHFSLLDDRDSKLLSSERALGSRIAGVLDNATSYMKQSAYQFNDEPIPDVKGAVIVFLHDFYDSPHVYAGMVFPDFWEWICFTIETLQEGNIKFFLKPHPNQIDLSDDVIQKLLLRFPSVNLLTSKITNKQLVDAGIVSGVTVYGTVAHELAFMGVPSVCCAYHPHISFDFCMTAKTRDEYKGFLKRSNDFSISKENLKLQSLIFYYMHNLHINNQTQVLIDYLSHIRTFLNRDSNDMESLEAIRKLIFCEELQGLSAKLNLTSN